MKYDISRLKNGLRVISATWPHVETVSVGVWVNTGSACENEYVNGISHFLEHMSFKGTKTRTALQIAEEIEDVGGQFNAYTSHEFTAFYAQMLKNDLRLAVEILADVLQNSTFPDDELCKEREVVVQEINQAIDTPDDAVFDYFQKTAFPNQALGRTILGPVNLVRSFSKNTLVDYMKTNYAAENMVLCAVGNIEHDELVRLAETYFSALQEKNNFTKDKQSYEGGFFKEKRNIEQAHVLLGFRGENYNSDNYYPMLIFSSIFGGGTASRLFQEIREKRGLVYTTYSFANSYSQSGLFGIYAGTGCDELKTLVPIIGDEINKIKEDGVTKRELDRAKIQMKAGMLMSLESSSSVSEILAKQHLLFNRIVPIAEMIDKIEAVEVDDVKSIAQCVFSSVPTYTLLGAVDRYMEYDDLTSYIKRG